MKVRWTEDSFHDLKTIHQYIAQDSPNYASRQIDRILLKEDIIAAHPRAGRVVPEYQDETVREVFEGSFRIIYRIVSKERIDILTVVHGMRELS